MTPPSPPSAVFEEDERVASSAVVVAEAAIGCQAEAPEFLDQDDLEARSAWDASDAPAPEKPALLVSHDFALHEDEFHSVHPQSRVVEADAEPFAARHSTIEPRPTSREPVLLSDAGPSWPSTSAILSANRSGQPGALAAPASQRRSRPEPTECRMPAFFALRSRAAIAAALVVAAFGGGASLFVAGLISLDNQAAGKAAALLDGGEAPLSPKMLTDLTRQGPWWATTAEHLRIKAALLGAVPDDAAATAETRALLERAAALNPADPAISAAISSERFATPDSAFDRYQPSRDIWPLVASARARFARGQADRAAENLRDAGTLAMQAEVDLAEPVTAAQDPPTDRLPLPNVPLFGPIAVALLDQKLSGVEGLRPLLPEYGPAWLAVYLEQQRRGQPQAELLGHLCELPDDAPDGASTALHLAARAEGLALRGELDRSIELYEAAIGHAQGRDWAAVLWINLSRLLTKNHQDERALAARQAAQRFTRNDSPAARRLKRWLDDAAHSRRDR